VQKAGRQGNENPGAPFIYIRYHGPRGDYGGTNSPQRLTAAAARIRDWLADGRDVYAFFNNDRDGCAPLDAQKLQKYLD
jgi:uncharacterized protein YecE (DUF72 family)